MASTSSPHGKPHGSGCSLVGTCLAAQIWPVWPESQEARVVHMLARHNHRRDPVHPPSSAPQCPFSIVLAISTPHSSVPALVRVGDRTLPPFCLPQAPPHFVYCAQDGGQFQLPLAGMVLILGEIPVLSVSNCLFRTNPDMVKADRT